jgi:hypothetical protein
MNEKVEPQYTHIIDDDEELIAGFNPFGNKPEGNISFHNLYSKLIANSSLIVEIKPSQIVALRKGLSDAKWKMNERLREEGQQPDERRIQFERVEETKNTLKIKISFQDSGITLISLTEINEKEI